MSEFNFPEKPEGFILTIQKCVVEDETSIIPYGMPYKVTQVWPTKEEMEKKIDEVLRLFRE